jgi:zinc transport system substrate-binding protein
MISHYHFEVEMRFKPYQAHGEKMKSTCTLVLLIIMVLMALSANGMAAEKNSVFVSISPQKFFVEQISGDFLQVEVMVKPGDNPHTYEPKPSQMKKLAQSSAYLAIGIGFEDAWLERFAGVNPEMKIVRTDAGIVKREIDAHHHHEEDHEDGDHDQEEDHKESHYEGEKHSAEHEHDAHQESAMDPHIWLSPVLVKKQAQTIADTLIDLYPQQQPIFEQNLAGFLARIDQLDQQLRVALKGKEGMKFMVFHPSWGYFADTYGLEQVAIEIEGKTPKSAQLQELIENAKAEGVKAIFVQPQFSTKSAEILAREIGGSVILIDPLAEDWFTNLQRVTQQIEKELK